jgi:hypothetical protein
MTITSGISDNGGGNTAYTMTATGANSQWYRNIGNNDGESACISIWMRRRTGSGTVYVFTASTATDKTATLTGSWQRFTFSRTVAGGVCYVGIQIVTSGDEVDVWRPQLEFNTGAVITAPSEYVSVGVLSSPYHGANVDGVKYFSITNGNTVANNVVTEATGAALNDSATAPIGYLTEPAAPPAPAAAPVPFPPTPGVVPEERAYAVVACALGCAQIYDTTPELTAET